MRIRFRYFNILILVILLCTALLLFIQIRKERKHARVKPAEKMKIPVQSQTPVSVQPKKPPTVPQGPPIAVFLSADIGPYIRFARSFSNRINMPVKEIKLKGNVKTDFEMMLDIIAEDPALILAVGGRAAYTAVRGTIKLGRTDIPILFAMVINWKRYKLLDGSVNVAGISVEPGLEAQLRRLKLVAPGVRDVGVVRGVGWNCKKIERLRPFANTLGMDFMLMCIRKPDAFQETFESMAPHIDAWWILPDPVVFTAENMKHLMPRCIGEGIVTMGCTYNTAKAGALMSYLSEPETLGHQAATMAKDILAGRKSIINIGVVPPDKPITVVNLKTANQIAVDIDRNVMDMTDLFVYY